MKMKIRRKDILLVLSVIFLLAIILTAINFDALLSYPEGEASVRNGKAALAERSPEIPVLYLEGDISGMVDKADIRDVTFEYVDGNGTLSGYAALKVQGNLSLHYEKKNYNIKFYHDAEHEKARKIDFGWGDESKYCLKANWIDKTHARNLVTANLVTQVQQKYDVLSQAPCNGVVDGFPIEIYVNGEFHGLYTFNIPKDAWMIGMDESNPNHIFVVAEQNGAQASFLEEPSFEYWMPEVGEPNEETLGKLKGLFDFVLNTTDEEFKADFEKHFDLDAALNYYVLLDFGLLNDNRAKNTGLATFDGEIWYLTLYDMDTSWGSRYDGLSLYPYDIEPLIYSVNNLLVRIEKNFPQELAQRYFELREDILTKEHVLEMFEAFRAQIPDSSFEKEYNKWGPDIPGYDYAQIEDYLDTNIPYLENKYSLMLAE